MPGRTIAIGDVHGCPAALRAVLEAAGPGPDDTVVTLGDYLDRGPDSKGVVEILLDLAGGCRLVPLLGNHEDLLLAALTDRKALEVWLRCGGDATVRSYGWVKGQGRRLAELFPPEHLQFLSGCRLLHETESHFFAHAGYVPELPLDAQPREALLWRVTDSRTARPHASGKVAVVGHTPQRSGEILDLGFLVCLDTDCQRGGWLTAWDVASGQVWQADERGRMRNAGPL
jgi:serine/threonine protein phosphatase 1